MKRFILLVLTVSLCAMTSICAAFEIDRSQWTNYANVNNIEAFYHGGSIEKEGNVAKVWICYHYKTFDTYRLMRKEYTRGSNRAKILKTLDYFSDGTFKQGSSKEIPDVGLGTNEEVILQRLW